MPVVCTCPLEACTGQSLLDRRIVCQSCGFPGHAPRRLTLFPFFYRLTRKRVNLFFNNQHTNFVQLYSHNIPYTRNFGFYIYTSYLCVLNSIHQVSSGLAPAFGFFYPVAVMCEFFGVSRSDCYAFVRRLGRPEKDAALAEVIAQQRERSFGTYDYRRMWLWLKSRGIFRNPKTVLRVMKKYGLLSEIRRRRKWQQVHRYKNLLNREFHADKPNSKWVTDISYIHAKQGRSVPVHDPGPLWQQHCDVQDRKNTADCNLDTVRLSMKREKKRAAAELQLHSNQGLQYTSQAYFNLIQAYDATPSISRKGNPYDNALAENFFSILKTECIYRHKPTTLSEANELLNRYIYLYNLSASS